MLDALAPASLVGSQVSVAVSMGGWPYLCDGVLSLDAPVECGSGQLIATEDGFRYTIQGSFGDEPRVFVSVRVDGWDVANQEANSTFGDPFAPNGKRCGPICSSGEGTIEISALYGS